MKHSLAVGRKREGERQTGAEGKDKERRREVK